MKSVLILALGITRIFIDSRCHSVASPASVGAHSSNHENILHNNIKISEIDDIFIV